MERDVGRHGGRHGGRPLCRVSKGWVDVVVQGVWHVLERVWGWEGEARMEMGWASWVSWVELGESGGGNGMFRCQV
jgi:hypothetical protein